jgi:transcriptional regulator with XRE-family HTH domain
VFAQPAFGQQLRALRRSRGLTQAELAGNGISTAYLSRLESGGRPPTARAVEYLAGRLGVNPSAFGQGAPGNLSAIIAMISSGGRFEAAASLRQALHESGAEDAALRWHGYWLLAELEEKEGLAADRRDTLKLLVAVSDETGSPELRLRARHQLATCHRSLGDILSAYPVAMEAYAIATADVLNVVDTARAFMALIAVQSELGRLPEARQLADELERLVVDGDSAAGGTTASGNAPAAVQAQVLWTSATVLTRQGESELASRRLDQAMERLAGSDDLVLWLRLRLAAASLYLQMETDSVDRVLHLLAEVGPAVRLAGLRQYAQEFDLLQGIASFRHGDLATARESCLRLDAVGQSLDFRDTVRLGLLKNQLLIAEGDRELAVANLRDLAVKAQRSAHVDLAAEIWRYLAEAGAAR